MRMRLIWLCVYLFANMITGWIIISSGELTGDLEGSPVYDGSTVFFAVLIVAILYYFLLNTVFNFFTRIKVTEINSLGLDDFIGNKIGLLLLLLQVGFLVFNLTTGVNVAGSNTIKTDSIFSIFWVLIPADALFIIYYGFYRDDKYFYSNFGVWVISNMSRGWMGFLIFVLFIELERLLSSNRIKIRHLFLAGFIVMVLYPLLTHLKFYFRIVDFGDAGFIGYVESLENYLSIKEYVYLIGDGIEHLVSRLQSISVLVEVIRLSSDLQDDFTKGAFTPFWLEGLHGILFEKLFMGEKSLPISVVISEYLNIKTDLNLGDSNMSTGYASWFFIAPELIPFYIVYTGFLGLLSVYFVKIIGNKESGVNMLWVVWLVYLLPAWLNTFVSFIYSLVVFAAIKLAILSFAKRN